MAVKNTDLLFINRDQVTFKINASEFGDYLINIDMPGGIPGKKYVNDGDVLIIGRVARDTPDGLGDDLWQLRLTSANQWRETSLQFAPGFVLYGNEFNPGIQHDMYWMADNIVCGPDLISDGTCIKIDMDWLTENIRCDNSGLEQGDDCIYINLCDYNGSNDGKGILQIKDNCLYVNICDGLMQGGNGCLMIDMEWLSNAIICNEDAGLIDNNGCISVDYDKVMAKLPLGRIVGGTGVASVSNNGDLSQGDVTINVNTTTTRGIGINGSFTTVDGKTITIEDGIVTAITEG